MNSTICWKVFTPILGVWRAFLEDQKKVIEAFRKMKRFDIETILKSLNWLLPSLFQGIKSIFPGTHYQNRKKDQKEK